MGESRSAARPASGCPTVEEGGGVARMSSGRGRLAARTAGGHWRQARADGGAASRRASPASASGRGRRRCRPSGKRSWGDGSGRRAAAEGVEGEIRTGDSDLKQDADGGGDERRRPRGGSVGDGRRK